MSASTWPLSGTAEVFEGPEELLIWGHMALEAALRGRNTKQLKPRKRPRQI